MDTDEIFFSEKQSSSNQIQSSFSDRQKSLFEVLKKAEDATQNRSTQNETPMDVNTSRESNKRKRNETKIFQGKESIFKRPEEPLSKCLPPRSIPDFKKNPHKWKKYSLDHVDISDRGNTHAALSFLREMEERKSNDDNKMEAEGSNKVQFNKSAIVRRKNVDDDKIDDKNIFKGSKVVMPEYVVGVSKKSVKKGTSSKNSSSSGKEVKLDHLLEYEDDDD